MKIELLQYFYDVATAKSISKVANVSYITQSALSQQLQKLEEEFGTSLLIRSNKGVELTKEGKIVFKYSQYILKNFSNLIEELESLRNEVTSITIYNDFIGSHVLINAIQNLRLSYPMYKFSIASNQINLTKDDKNSISELNIFLYYNNLKNKDTNYVSLGFDKLVPVCNVAYNVDDMLKLETLIKEPFLYLNHPIISDLFEKALIKKRLSRKDLNPLYSSNNYLDILDGLYNNLGFNLLPLSLIYKELNDGILKIVKLTENIQFNFECSLSYNSKTLEPLIQNFKNDFIKFLNDNS